MSEGFHIPDEMELSKEIDRLKVIFLFSQFIVEFLCGYRICPVSSLGQTAPHQGWVSSLSTAENRAASHHFPSFLPSFLSFYRFYIYSHVYILFAYFPTHTLLGRPCSTLLFFYFVEEKI
jgi:hypothetical protein